MFFVFWIIATTAHAKLPFDYAQLQMKTSDDMSKMVNERIAEAQLNDAEAPTLLKETLKIVLARPDQDGIRSKLFTQVMNELRDLQEPYPTLEKICEEAFAAIRDDKLSTRVRATYITILNNLIPELKSEMKANTTAKKLLELIRDERIVVPAQVMKKEKMTTMRTMQSPSKVAESILDGSKKK